MNRYTTRLIIICISILTLVFIIASLYSQQKKSTSDNKKGPVFTASQPDAAVLVLDVVHEPGRVLIVRAELPRPGYVVAQEEMYGAPGIVVGVSPYIERGRIEHLTIELTRAFSGIEQFYVSVRADNGDGRFKQIDDGVMTDAAGNPAQAMVVLQGAGSEPLDVALPRSVQTQ